MNSSRRLILAVPLPQPPAEPFSNFDDQSNNLIGSLHLDADDEPRRIGATSRANSVRFDESANQGHWSQTARSSIDLIPRAGSGFGSHPMTERSYSHKSDGRQSSAGHSVHSATSGRANSLGIETNFAQSSSSINEPPPSLAPGLLILGTVPSIIRCWLSNNFKHDTLLYAAVCSGSYSSFLSANLIDDLGFTNKVQDLDDGSKIIELPVYLPEAVPHPTSSRPNNHAPQLPSIIVKFRVYRQLEAPESKTIKIFLGSDALRARNADILFSSNRLTLFDDEQCKLSIPLVRPENEFAFKSLFISSGDSQRRTKIVETERCHAKNSNQEFSDAALSPPTIGDKIQSSVDALKDSSTLPTNREDDPELRNRLALTERPPLSPLHLVDEDRPDAPQVATANQRTESSPAIWSSWRKEGERPQGMVWAGVSKGNNGAGYQRRDQGMKVLKPLRSASRTAAGNPTQSVSPITSQSRFFDDGKRRASLGQPSENGKAVPSGVKEKEKEKEKDVHNKPRSANPIGGASAFAWLNPSK